MNQRDHEKKGFKKHEKTRVMALNCYLNCYKRDGHFVSSNWTRLYVPWMGCLATELRSPKKERNRPWSHGRNGPLIGDKHDDLANFSHEKWWFPMVFIGTKTTGNIEHHGITWMLAVSKVLNLWNVMKQRTWWLRSPDWCHVQWQLQGDNLQLQAIGDLYMARFTVIIITGEQKTLKAPFKW